VSSLHSENYSTSKPLNFSPEKSQILSCDTVVANERYKNSEDKVSLLTSLLDRGK
jgi:hypothetical protein